MRLNVKDILKPKKNIKKLKTRLKQNFFDKYSVGKFIGGGIYGNIYMCYSKYGDNNKNTSNKLVVKRLLKNNVDDTFIRNEILILKKLRNLTHIVNLIYYGKCKNGNTYLVFEKCEMDLKTFMKSGSNNINNEIKFEICKQITMGLEFCHLKGIIHGDLKLDNVLIHEDCTIKLCDFGLSVINKNKKNKKNKNENESVYERHDDDDGFDDGYDDNNVSVDDNNDFIDLIPDKYAILYRPLEFTLLNVFNYYSDVWALGCIIHEIFLGFLLFNSSKCRRISKKTIENCTFVIFSTLGKFDQSQLNIYSGSLFFKKILRYTGIYYNNLNLHKEQRESLFANKKSTNDLEIKIYKILNECMNYNYWERINCTELLKIFN